MSLPIKPLTYSQLKDRIACYPSETLRFRNIGSNSVELISVSRGGFAVVSLGRIKLNLVNVDSDERNA